MAEMREHNLAYDYNIYEEAEQSNNAAVEAPAEKKRNSTVSRHKTASVIKAFGIAVVTLGILCYMIYGKVELTGLYSEQSKLQNELTRLTNENVSLESELTQKTGLTKVENYAENQLGLKKLDKSQIEFIDVPKREVAVASAPANDNLFVRIRNWFNGVLEYIGVQ